MGGPQRRTNRLRWTGLASAVEWRGMDRMHWRRAARKLLVCTCWLLRACRVAHVDAPPLHALLRPGALLASRQHARPTGYANGHVHDHVPIVLVCPWVRTCERARICAIGVRRRVSEKETAGTEERHIPEQHIIKECSCAIPASHLDGMAHVGCMDLCTHCIAELLHERLLACHVIFRVLLKPGRLAGEPLVGEQYRELIGDELIRDAAARGCGWPCLCTCARPGPSAAAYEPRGVGDLQGSRRSGLRIACCRCP